MALTAQPKRRQTVSDRKRIGQHHKVSKRYSRTYWPYLPMLLIVVAGLILNVTWNTSRGVLGYATSVSISDLLQDTNNDRAQNGLGSLNLNSELTQAAQAKAVSMVTLDYWSHVTPSGEQPWQFISAAGYKYQTAGENLAYGFDTSSDVIAAWMNSPEHRANILDTTYKDVGFGIANSADFQGTGEETIVVAEYAEPVAAVAPVAQAVPAAPKQTASAAPQPQPQPTPASQPPAQTTTAAPPTQTPTQTTVSSQTAPAEKITEAQPKVITAKQVSRIGVLTNGNAQWASLALSTLATISILGFLVKHGRLWQRYLTRGEAFIIRHPFFDTMLVAIAVIGFVLTRSSGFIQ